MSTSVARMKGKNNFRDPAFDAAVAIAHAMRSLVEQRMPSHADKRAEQRKAERWHNRLESLRTLLGIFEWRYLLLPVGIRELSQLYYEGEHAMRVRTRNLHVFGIRIARWVVGTSLHRLVPEPPPARLRLRPWRRKKVKKP